MDISFLGRFRSSPPVVHGAPWQPGLGTFSYLPPEIRNVIWDLILQSIAPLNHSVNDTDKKQLPDAPIPITELMIIYASKQLYHNITNIYYGNNIEDVQYLNICLGHPDHDLVQERQAGKYTNYHLQFNNGVIRSRDLAYTNFSFFASINLQLELPIQGTATRTQRFNTLKYFVSELSDLIQDWQSRRPWWSIAPCPPIHVSVEIPTEERSVLFSWDMTLERLADLLKPLADIDNCEYATIDFRGELLCGREWVPEIFGQIIRNMRREGKDFTWFGENTVDAVMFSGEETERVKRRVSELERRQETRRRMVLPVEDEMDGDEDEEKRKKREVEECKAIEEDEEMVVLSRGTLSCGPPESQPDTEFSDLFERARAKHVLARISVMIAFLDLLVLDWLWVPIWSG
ncbi:MAG: hypothetical protein Q9221_006002 [Calogaya cf. arnoldii]